MINEKLSSTLYKIPCVTGPSFPPRLFFAWLQIISLNLQKHCYTTCFSLHKDFEITRGTVYQYIKNP